MAAVWRKLRMPVEDVTLEWILPSGQAFRWKRHDSEWISVLQDQIVVLRNCHDCIQYRFIQGTSTISRTAPLTPPPSSPSSPGNIQDFQNIDDFLHDYFNASTDLSKLYKEISARDKVFKSIVAEYPGIRLLRQDPWETLCSFICSSNNSIKRITQMIDAMCNEFGTYITTYEGTPYYTFPRPEVLSQPSTVSRLRQLGFGYRAEYVHKTAKLVSEWQDSGHNLAELRGKPYSTVREFLLEFPGVGPKVADCVCLMAFDCPGSVPIDTHIWNFIKRRYNPKKVKMVTKTMTRNSYDQIADYTRGLWGDHAGWAQAVSYSEAIK
ncbi:DNA glycosylase [Lipomyces oligophaga]|uniref:DNA glycosylase n=1 Tax=Lipomyces oligophaga TaxID=45792 RepID=UPI0034CDF578